MSFKRTLSIYKCRLFVVNYFVNFTTVGCKGDTFTFWQKRIVHDASHKPPYSCHQFCWVYIWFCHVTWLFIEIHPLTRLIPIVLLYPFSITCYDSFKEKFCFCLASNETHISKHFYCCLSLSSCGHKSNFFTFPSFFNSLEAEDVLVSRYAECSNGLKRVILHSKSNAICWQLTFELFIHFQMMCLLLKISQTNSKWPVCLHFLP